VTTIAVVTAWREHLELADDYFEAVLPELEDGDVSIVVDDCSDPPRQFGTFFSSERIGFCGACNVGLGMAETDAVLFLNNDIVLERRGWLQEVRDALEPGVLVGPLRSHVAAKVDGHSIPYIDGWCLAGMREDLNELGGFDGTLAEPAYYSDNILCLHARSVGMTLREVRPGLRHLENMTAGPGWSPTVKSAAEANRAKYVELVRALLVSA
jgi:GT2 family glycosyltransferase